MRNAVGNAAGNTAGNAVGNAVGNLVGNGWGNDAVFSLNTWLRMIYCLQTIHEPACVILTLFQFFAYYLFEFFNEIFFESFDLALKLFVPRI